MRSGFFMIRLFPQRHAEEKSRANPAFAYHPDPAMMPVKLFIYKQDNRPTGTSIKKEKL